MLGGVRVVLDYESSLQMKLSVLVSSMGGFQYGLYEEALWCLSVTQPEASLLAVEQQLAPCCVIATVVLELSG